VLHLEDDWAFDPEAGSFLRDSLAVLAENPSCFQVHLRHRASSVHPVHATELRTKDGVAYRRLLYDWAAGGDEGLRWQGFSLGPGLRRLSHIRALGDLETYGSEIHVQAAFKSFGLWAAALEHGVLEHTGDNYSQRVVWESSTTRAGKVV
jgi:hypothetical protein